MPLKIKMNTYIGILKKPLAQILKKNFHKLLLRLLASANFSPYTI